MIDEGKVIGATTCIPLIEKDKEFQRPLQNAGFNIDKAFYFGESIILKNYRGQKIGHQFFEMRETHAKNVYHDLDYTCFCSVDRTGHPLRPKDYRPLNSFWNRLGYKEFRDIFVRYSWKDIDKENEDEKTMHYWLKQWKN